MDDSKKLKMYILVKESLPSHKAVAVAHGVLMCHLRFCDVSPDYISWLYQSFRKVVCEVTGEEFFKAKALVPADSYVIVNESSLNNQEVALAFCPRYEWPKEFKFYKLANW